MMLSTPDKSQTRRTGLVLLSDDDESYETTPSTHLRQKRRRRVVDDNDDDDNDDDGGVNDHTPTMTPSSTGTAADGQTRCHITRYRASSSSTENMREPPCGQVVPPPRSERVPNYCTRRHEFGLCPQRGRSDDDGRDADDERGDESSDGDDGTGLDVLFDKDANADGAVSESDETDMSTDEEESEAEDASVSRFIDDQASVDDEDDDTNDDSFIDNDETASDTDSEWRPEYDSNSE